VDHHVVFPDFEEVPEIGEIPDNYVIRNASGKAASVIRIITKNPGKIPLTWTNTLVISCDTIVVIDNQILEKPKDQADARRMLNELSGRTHRVISGVCLTLLGSPDQSSETSPKSIEPLNSKTFKVSTAVTIKHLSPAEIAAYVATGEPMDKAGGYAAQGIGAYMIERIDGSYSNVVGLPLTELVQSIRDHFHIHLW
jgi:septum formation protein